MVYADPVPDSLASGEHYQGLAGSLYLSPDKLAADYALVRFARELRLFRQFCPAGRVLDVGCSTGAFLAQLERRWPGQYERLGTDVVGVALDHAESRGVPVRRQSFLEPPPENRPWDAITFWAVLEHLADPHAFLRQAAALLRPGGHCFILVPNLRSLAVRLLGPSYRYVMPEHVNYFTADTLRRLAARIPGLSEVHATGTHFNPMVILQDARRGTQPATDADRVALLRRTTGWKQRKALAPLRPLYRAAEGVLGKLGLADNLVLVLRKEGLGPSGP
ncbi:MAG: hypothetical protein RJA22_128 [Verrucomicrobiota bacterium]